jgi:hypothetical protein
MVVRIAAARMIARWARSPSSPAPAAHRCAALGLDRPISTTWATGMQKYACIWGFGKELTMIQSRIFFLAIVLDLVRDDFPE